jgi:hypothetical protein
MYSLTILSGHEDPQVKALEDLIMSKMLTPTLTVAYKYVILFLSSTNVRTKSLDCLQLSLIGHQW